MNSPAARTASPFPARRADWSTLPGFSDVINTTTRYSLGAEYELRQGIYCYFYYNYYDFQDKAGNGQTGTTNSFLGGLTAVY